MKIFLILFALLSTNISANQPGVINPPNTFTALVRFNNGTTTTLTINAINMSIARDLAQAQCGGPSNCTIMVVSSKN
jgi:hypothetical protein